MFRRMLKSKIHRAVVTDADVSYEGSITIDPDLMEAAEMVEYEEVHVWDLTNGARISTYVIPGERGSGTVAINGAAAHLVKRGDEVIVASFADYEDAATAGFAAKKVFVDSRNRIVRSEPSCACTTAGADSSCGSTPS